MTPTPDPADLDALLDDIQGAMGTDAYADKPGYNRGVKALSELRRILLTPTPDPAASAREALAGALHEKGIGCMQPFALSRDVCVPSDPRYDDFHPSAARIILAALRSDPEAARAVAAALVWPKGWVTEAGFLTPYGLAAIVEAKTAALRAESERLREALRRIEFATEPVQGGEAGLREPGGSLHAIARSALDPAAPTPGEEPSICGAQHPEHPGTHCRRRPVHSGEHATARYDVTWDNAYLSAPGEGPSICGAHHPEHPGTHCRRKQGHSGEHATARHDVQWDNAYLSAPGEEPSDG